MMQRCENPEHHKFHLYGAKGVTVCDRWKEFHNFYADMGKRPSLKHTLDRIEGNAGYEPGNCRWATATVQNNNRDSVRTVEFDGQSLTVRDLIDRFGSAVDHRTLSKRIARGWDIKKALETPAVEAKGRIVSDDARERMRQSALKRKDRTRGYQQSEETKQKIRESLTGRKASDETRRKLSEVHKGRIHSDEAKEKIRQAALARPKRTLSEETKTRIKEGMLKHRAAERNAK